MGKIDNGLERVFERSLFGCRLLVLVAVIGLLVAAMLMFVKGGVAIAQGAGAFFQEFAHFADEHSPAVILHFITAVDNFLFATVLLIFSMGIYELFVSKIDPCSRTAETRPNWLKVKSLDDLKTYLGKVVLMILIVSFFEQSFHLAYKQPLDLLYLGGGIGLVALSLFLTHGKGHGHRAGAKSHENEVQDLREDPRRQIC